MRIYLFLLFQLACGWPLAYLPAVNLEMIDTHFVRLHMGNPSRPYTYYVSLAEDRIIIASWLQASTELESHSFETTTGQPTTELFLLGPYLLRFPLSYGNVQLARQVRLGSKQVVTGILGLGPGSPLWKYWGNYSITRDKLVLGDADAGDASFDGQPALRQGQGVCENPASGTTSSMLLDFGTMEMALPHQLYTEHPASLVLRESGCLSSTDGPECVYSNEIKLRNQSIVMLTGTSYNAVDHSHDNQVHIGRRFLYDITMFYRFYDSSIFLADNLGTESDFNAIYAILLTLLSWIWVLLVFGRRSAAAVQPTQTERVLLYFLEVFIFEMVVACWANNFLIFRWSYAVRMLLSDISWFSLFFLHGSIAVSLTAAIAVLWIAWTGDTRRLFPWHLLTLANAVLPSLWISFVQHHRFNSDAIFLVLFATSLCIINGSIFLISFFAGNRIVAYISVFPLLASYMFLFADNLMIVHEEFLIESHQLVFLLEFLLLGCVLPSLAIASTALRNKASQMVQTAKPLAAAYQDPHSLEEFQQLAFYYSQPGDINSSIF